MGLRPLRLSTGEGRQSEEELDEVVEEDEDELEEVEEELAGVEELEAAGVEEDEPERLSVR
jgi:hypothetical protein